MENPGSSYLTPKYAILNGEGSLWIKGTYIVLNTPKGGPTLKAPAFTCNAPAGTAVGLHFVDCIWVQGGNFQPQAHGALHNMLIAGTGRASARGCDILAFRNSSFCSIGLGAQLLANADFETGTVSGWLTQTGGGAGTNTFTADSANQHTGRYSGKITAQWTSGSAVSLLVYQRFAVTPGEIVYGGMYYKNDIAPITNGGQLNIQLRWRDGSGGDQGPANFTSLTTTNGWTYKSFGALAPAGACFVDVEILCSANSAQSKMVIWIDDLLLNIIRA
jgi:hypothetical protein